MNIMTESPSFSVALCWISLHWSSIIRLVLPVPDSSDDDEDDVPLVNLLKKTKEEKPSKQTAGQTLSSEAPQTQHVIFHTGCISVCKVL